MRRWFKYVKPYWPWFVLGPLCMIIEVIGEVRMPTFLQRVINAKEAGTLSSAMGWEAMGGMIFTALYMMAGGIGGAWFGAKATVNFAGDLREDIYRRIQTFSFSNIDKFSTASIVTRLEEAEIYPSAGIFVGRGLADAVKCLVRDTGLGAKLYADRIPFEGNSFELGRKLDLDPVSAAMNGGDDCRLLFVVPILALERFRRDFQEFSIVGHLAQSEVGAVLVTPDGAELPLRAQGWPQAED